MSLESDITHSSVIIGGAIGQFQDEYHSLCLKPQHVTGSIATSFVTEKTGALQGQPNRLLRCRKCRAVVWPVLVYGEEPRGCRRDAPGPDARPNTKPCIAKTTNLRPVFDLAQIKLVAMTTAGSELKGGGPHIGLIEIDIQFQLNNFYLSGSIFVKSRSQEIWGGDVEGESFYRKNGHLGTGTGARSSARKPTLLCGYRHNTACFWTCRTDINTGDLFAPGTSPLSCP